jgi:archaeal histone
MAEIPKAVVARLIRLAGADRVSSGAVESMTEVLEKVCGVVGAEAVRLSKYTGRQTVKGVDVIEAASRRVILITAEPAK